MAKDYGNKGQESSGIGRPTGTGPRTPDATDMGKIGALASGKVDEGKPTYAGKR